MRLAIILVMFLLAGCNGRVYHLPDEYEPLKYMREMGLQKSTRITTTGDTVWVKDIENWLRDHPVGSAIFHGIMLHEQEHARRQLDYGLAAWSARYLSDTGFMRDEELRGWYLQLKEWQRRGILVNPWGVAKSLAGYWNVTGQMISEEDALKWTQDVLAGRWSPPDED